MPVKEVRYGYSVRPRFAGDSRRVLMGKKAHRIIKRARRLSNAFTVKPDGRVVFLHGIKGKYIGEGLDGKVYLIEPESLRKIGLKQTGKRFVLKAYTHPQTTDGITQYASIFAVYNFLKKRELRHVLVRAPPVYAGGRNFLVSELVNKPTIRQIKTFFEMQRKKARGKLDWLDRIGIGTAGYFPFEKVPEFLQKAGITEKQVLRAYEELKEQMRSGRRINFGSKMPAEIDLLTDNFFVYGKKGNEIVVSVFDQGSISIQSLLAKLEKMDK